MPVFNIDEIEKATMSGLKDFQQATVERVDQLYRSGQNRVLVADEVGMGKTLIARGVIVKAARLRIEEQDDLFKVVYICSNQTIANQNIRKLDITGGHAIESVADTRLSMQHLKIAEQENSSEGKDRYIQLIPLTPETSFHISTGRGSVNERALMFAVLRRMEEFQDKLAALEDFMRLDALASWDSWAKQAYENRVRECETLSGGSYPVNVIEQIRNYPEFGKIKSKLDKHLNERCSGQKLTCKNGNVMTCLRIMFARISVSMLHPDLVIMDEFQRFKLLLSSSDDTETGILVKNFLTGQDTRILLLSATPYKLYSTPEEIEKDQNEEEAYGEFYDVMKFLFPERKKQFHKVWSDYSAALSELKSKDAAILHIGKQTGEVTCQGKETKRKDILQLKTEAQDFMYGGMCRTERISVMESGDYTDDSSVQMHLSVQESDIESWLEMAELLRQTNSKYTLPVDYVKSCPYLMSFMKKYKVKEELERYFTENPGQIEIATRKKLWIDKDTIDSYKELPVTNARLNDLLKRSLEHGEELLLWVPPSKPYYPLQGVYKDKDKFSKILIFSSWEMVPRMIGSLASYESERKTIGRLAKRERNRGRKNIHYFAKKKNKNEDEKFEARFPTPRLQFKMTGGEARSMSMFCLLYPSKTLAEIYDPISSMNEGLSLEQLECRLRDRLRSILTDIGSRYGTGASTGREDARWYYLAPMLSDGISFAQQWMTDIKNQMKPDETSTSEDRKRESKNFLKHIGKLDQYLKEPDKIALGREPVDLEEVLVNMVLGSPAVCAYRSNGGNEARATELARVFIANFNLPEATAIVDLAYGESEEDDVHWKNVLKYCRDGCLQSVLDEYQHILSESVSFGDEKDAAAVIHHMMINSLRIRTSAYEVDTFDTFRNRISGKSKDQGVRIRSSYACGFTREGGDNERQVYRKESVRNAFNSPMRPFVLATTSIGQEGLDFHNYCRKVVHWNLPSNPIDLEQREGRVNRFKCLAVRQNVAEQYGNITFHSDVWKEMFDAAREEKPEGVSELVPYWCCGKNQKVKIERIVPMYPISRDEVNYERLIKILSLYRLTLGQARQEELLDYLFREFDDTEALKKLFLDLSPFSRTKKITEKEPK